jgi:hypothetical protein
MQARQRLLAPLAGLLVEREGVEPSGYVLRGRFPRPVAPAPTPSKCKAPPELGRRFL